MTIYDLAVWIHDNRRGRAFKNLTFEEIVFRVAKACEEGCLRYTMKDGQFTGVALFQLDYEKKEFETFSTLTTSRDAVKQFVLAFRREFPGWKMIMHHRGRKRNHNTDRYINKILGIL